MLDEYPDILAAHGHIAISRRASAPLPCTKGTPYREWSIQSMAPSIGGGDSLLPQPVKFPGLASSRYISCGIPFGG